MALAACGSQWQTAEAARRIVASEFRVAASGRLADPDAALELLDLGRLVGEDEEPDKGAIKAVIERLVPVAAPASKVPSGPRDTQPELDFIRSRLSARRGEPAQLADPESGRLTCLAP